MQLKERTRTEAQLKSTVVEAGERIGSEERVGRPLP